MEFCAREAPAAQMEALPQPGQGGLAVAQIDSSLHQPYLRFNGHTSKAKHRTMLFAISAFSRG
jgi:hypothetical protein